MRVWQLKNAAISVHRENLDKSSLSQTVASRVYNAPGVKPCKVLQERHATRESWREWLATFHTPTL